MAAPTTSAARDSPNRLPIGCPQVHTVAELERMLRLDSLEGCMLGINNRDLQASRLLFALPGMGASGRVQMLHFGRQAATLWGLHPLHLQTFVVPGQHPAARTTRPLCCHQLCQPWGASLHPLQTLKVAWAAPASSWSRPLLLL